MLPANLSPVIIMINPSFLKLSGFANVVFFIVLRVLGISCAGNLVFFTIQLSLSTANFKLAIDLALVIPASAPSGPPAVGLRIRA